MVRSLMSQRTHILISQGAQDREVRDLSRRLKGIIINYRFRQISLARAKRLGARVIDQHYRKLLDLSQRRIRVSTHQVAELTPETKRRLDNWRKQAVEDFEAILEDVK